VVNRIRKRKMKVRHGNETKRRSGKKNEKEPLPLLEKRKAKSKRLAGNRSGGKITKLANSN